MDYTVIPNHLKKMLERLGAPLTEDQYLYLLGGLAQIQSDIETEGLKFTIGILTSTANQVEHT